MKRLICLSLVILMLSSVFAVTVCAEASEFGFSSSSTVLLRAGGGNSGGGGGGGGGAGGGSHSHHSRGNREPTLLESVMGFIMMLVILSSSSIVFYFQITKRSRKSKRLMKKIKKSDRAWKYKNVSKNVEESFFAIQNAWTNMDLSTASKYMSDELLDSFNTKLSWMEYKKQRNVLKKIKLLRALPVAVYDDSDDTRDYIWFYIKGKMVDYTIDTDTHMVLEGSKLALSFVEYWRFIRKDGRWVLDKILQKNEEAQIPFSE